ncbi:MAG: hypothetical protein LBD90_07525 [Bifidobacteriaceae bacterium]|nr:hypothetical protein [Bifidobacteriaceae bacterium]
MNPCSGSHTVQAVDKLAGHLSQAGLAIRQAIPLIELAHPDGWVSPAAAAYQGWVGDLVWRCRRAKLRADEAVDQVNTCRALIVGKLGEL